MKREHFKQAYITHKFIMSPSEAITYKTYVEPVVVKGISLLRLTVEAIDNETVVYSLSIDLEEIR